MSQKPQLQSTITCPHCGCCGTLKSRLATRHLSLSRDVRRKRPERGSSHGKKDQIALCKLLHKDAHMATNLAIDPDLLDRALQVSGERTKKAAVTKALQEFIARREQRHLLDLMGKLEWDPSFDYKAERSRK